MKSLDYREFYRRNLPHIQPRGATFLVNFRLVDSLPKVAIETLRVRSAQMEKALLRVKNLKEKPLLRNRQHQELFTMWDDAIDNSQVGPFWLKDERIADIVVQSIRYHDGEWFDVEAYCIMPNHVHLVLTPYEISETADHSLAKIMHNIKRNSANHANKFLARTGAFWQHENYDHFARDEAELERLVKYVLYNPVKANLVKEQQDWAWSYCKHGM